MKNLISLFIMILLIFSNHLITYARGSQQLKVKSEAAILLDAETGAVLFAKNEKERLYPASLTKIATAIYAIEKGKLDELVTISRNAAGEEGTRVYLNEGEKVPLKNLIQGMLINSGNDAAVAIAEHLDGSVERFSFHINHYLKIKIGVHDTHFTNPNGLFAENHYTTALDLALITNYAKRNRVFSEIFGTKELKWQGQSWHTTLMTHHRMLKGEIPFQGITGGKTGYIDESKHTLATTAENGKIQLIAIALKASRNNQVYNDTTRMMDFGFHGFHHLIIKHTQLFKKGKKEYFPLKDTVITEPIYGSLKSVDKRGILEVRNDKGQLVQSVPLTYKKPVLNDDYKFLEHSPYHVNAFYGIIVFAFSGIYIGLRRKYRRKSQKS